MRVILMVLVSVGLAMSLGMITSARRAQPRVFVLDWASYVSFRYHSPHWAALPISSAGLTGRSGRVSRVPSTLNTSPAGCRSSFRSHWVLVVKYKYVVAFSFF